jgi:hypothetical protein
MYKKQKPYEGQLQKLDLRDRDAFSCACYLPEIGNTPAKGDILAWSESSAVAFANSVLGARSNRNSGGIDFLCNVLQKAPEFDLLTDTGRQAKWLVDVQTSSLPNPQLLGSAIGLKVVEAVPFIAGLDRFLNDGLNDEEKDYFKEMGAASASNGAVGLYHADNLTPEAVELGRDLLVADYQTYVIDDAEIARVKASYPNIWADKQATPKKAFVGCPHLSAKQLLTWTDNLEAALKVAGQEKVKVDTYFVAPPAVAAAFKKDADRYQRLVKSGVRLTSICPLMYMMNPMSGKRPVVTNSNKLRTYSSARFFEDAELLRILATGTIQQIKEESNHA